MVSLLDRFNAKVRRGAEDECWEWTGARTSHGYGQIWFAGRVENAHRMAYVLFVGRLEPGLEICHRCDNPPCVNPRHLFQGTRAENGADMARKGRASRHGLKIGKSRWPELRMLMDDGVSLREIGRRWSVSDRTIRRARDRMLSAEARENEGGGGA